MYQWDTLKRFAFILTHQVESHLNQEFGVFFFITNLNFNHIKWMNFIYVMGGSQQTTWKGKPCNSNAMPVKLPNVDEYANFLAQVRWAKNALLGS